MRCEDPGKSPEIKYDGILIIPLLWLCRMPFLTLMLPSFTIIGKTPPISPQATISLKPVDLNKRPISISATSNLFAFDVLVLLIIGVNDYGEILGLENDYYTLKKKNKDGFQQRIVTIIANEFGKDICPKIHIEFHQIQGEEVCSILVEPSSRPVYFNQGNRTIFILRTGNVTNPLTTSETVKYLQSKSLN